MINCYIILWIISSLKIMLEHVNSFLKQRLRYLNSKISTRNWFAGTLRRRPCKLRLMRCVLN